MAIKLDMAKAYDRAEWEFLLTMTAKMGFAPLLCIWIKECISTASFNILLNGNLTGYILPKRGAEAGRPIFSLLISSMHVRVFRVDQEWNGARSSSWF